jgi:excisionase family DNA binding protein
MTAACPCSHPPGVQSRLAAEAAEHLHVPPRFIRTLIAERRVLHFKMGKYVRLKRSDLDAFVAAGRVEAS